MIDRADVLIAGGGPAGAAVAIALASAGQRVVLLERERFPRPRIGESLPPKIEQLLAALGALEAVEAAGFVRMRGTTVAIGPVVSRHDFDPSGGRLGYQVERDRFDAILLARARTVGAEVLEETALLEPIAAGGRVEGARIGSAGHEREVRAAITVDAGGSAAPIARALGLRRRESIRTVALAGLWRGARGAEELPPENTLFDMLEDGWVWSVLRSDGRRNLTVGLDAEAVKSRREPLEALYRRKLARSSLIAPLLDGAELDGDLSAHDATWASAENPIGTGWLLAGDASSVIDPLTSQGVYKAIQSGLSAAAAIRTVLARPADARLAAEYYQRSERTIQARYAEVALSFYRASPYADRPFWAARLDPERHPAPDRALPPPELRAERRRAFFDRLRQEGGRALALCARPGLRLAALPVVESGLVVAKEIWADQLGGEIAVPSEAAAIEPRVLLPLLDGRSIEALFEGYAARSGLAPSSDLARRIVAALGALAELDLIETRSISES